MKRMALLLAPGAILGFWSTASAQQGFRPPEATSASDAYVAAQVAIEGLLVVDVRLSERGEIRRIDVLRGPGSLLINAKNTLRDWKFQPASEHGKTKASRLTVAFLYRPPTNYGLPGPTPPKDFVPVIPPDQASDTDEQTNYDPVGIEAFAYPNYPVKSVAWGSVVVQLTVSDTGAVKDVQRLRAMAGFDNLAVEALEKWRFRPAMLRGKRVSSKIVIAFVFRTPISSN